MNSSPSSLSRRGFLSTTGTLGAAAGLGQAATTTDIGTTTATKDAPEPDWTFPDSPDDSGDEQRPVFVYPVDVSDGVALVLSTTLQRTDGHPLYTVYGFDKATGDVEWSRSYSTITLPIIEDGTVFLSVGVESDDDTVERRFVALNLGTGEERWRKSVGSFSSNTRVDTNHVYLLSNRDRAVVALDTENGERKWTFSFDGDYASNMFLFDGTLYLSEESNLYAVSVEDGKQRWKRTWSWTNVRLLSVTENAIICRINSDVRAVDPKSGDELWSADGGRVMVTDGGRVYSWGESLRAIDMDNGAIRWQYDDVEPIDTEPVVADGAVFGVNRSGTVHSIATDGTKRWTFEADVPDDSYSTSCDVRDGLVYAMLGRTLYVLSAEDGSVKWSFTGAGRAVSTVVTYDAVLFGTRGGLYVFARHHSLLDTIIDDTGEFVSSDVGLGLTGVIVGTAAFAAYRRLNGNDGSMVADSSEPEPKYGRLERLDEDEFTETYRVRKRTDDGPEVVAHRELTDPQVAGTFRSATERWVELNDRPGVVPILETDGNSIERPYYADGSLADSDRPVADRLEALSAANSVVHDAHCDGLIHGGLTPASILLDGDDVGVADWELAAALAEFRDPSPYAAPEQVAGAEADERTDVYRLGSIAAFVLTGKAPDEESLVALDPDHRAVMLAQAAPDEYESLRSDPVSPELYEAVSNAMADDPDDRYGSLVAFDDMLRWAAFRA